MYEKMLTMCQENIILVFNNLKYVSEKCFWHIPKRQHKNQKIKKHEKTMETKKRDKIKQKSRRNKCKQMKTLKIEKETKEYKVTR